MRCRRIGRRSCIQNVSILYWRCSTQMNKIMHLPLLLISFQFSIGDAVWKRLLNCVYDLGGFNSLLEMQPQNAETLLPRKLTPRFNSLLEMHFSFSRLPPPQWRGQVSILYWRCPGAACLIATSLAGPGFQFSIGDAADGDGGHQQRKRVCVSILYWRCGSRRVAGP